MNIVSIIVIVCIILAVAIFSQKKSNVFIHILCPGPVKTNFDNVAGVSFSLNGMNSDYVAKYAIDKMLKGKFIIIPGFSIKMLRFVSKIVPDCLLIRMVYNSQKRKRNN